MRVIGRLLILAAVVAALLAALDMVVIGNTQGAQLNLPGLAIRASLGFVVAAALALGILVAVLLLLPGRLRAAWRNGHLSRRAQGLEDELQALQALQEPQAPPGAGGQTAAATEAGAPAPAVPHRTAPILPPGAPRAGRPLRIAQLSSGAPAQPVPLAAGAAPSAHERRGGAPPGSLPVGRVAGIRVSIHVSWLIIVALLTASLATTFFPQVAPGYAPGVYWLVGLAATLLLFVSVLLHELGHSLVARARGLPVSSITLFIFGGVSNLEQEPRGPGEEFLVAAIGPAISLVLGGLVLALAPLVGRGDLLARSLVAYLGGTNVLLGLFNLLPGFPMDGGRVLRAALWRLTGSLQTATHWAARVGQGLAFLFILLGVWLFFAGDLLAGIWTGFIGWFVLNAAQSATAQVTLDAALRGVTVAQVMTAAPPAVAAASSVQAAVEELIWPQGLGGLLVEEAGRVVGMITAADIRRIPRDQWALTTVGHAMVPAERLPTAAPRQQLSAALALLAAHNVDQLLVVQNGEVVGLLTRDGVARLVEARRGLEPERPQRQDGARAPAGPGRPDLPASA
jgi:Zn-dependent protease/CBS domain-containing protein